MFKIPSSTHKILLILLLTFLHTRCQQDFLNPKPGNFIDPQQVNFVDPKPADYIDPSPVQNIQKPTIIQANHYYSNKEKSISYKVTSLNQTLPVFIIPKNQNKERISYSNRINVTLNDNQGNYISCLFQDNFEICVLEKFNKENLSMIIQCDSLPCDFSWTMLQTSIQKIDTFSVRKSSVKELYEIQQSQQNRHLTIKVSCDSPQFEKDFHNNLQFYANKQNYRKIKTNGLTYFLFKNPPTSFKEYFYIRINEKYRQCAQIQIFNQQTSLNTNTTVHDFVTGGSNINYKLVSHSTDMRMDTNVHLFSQSLEFDGSLNIKLMGNIGGISQIIRSMSLQPKKKTKIEFSFVLNNITSHYSDLELMIESTKFDCLINFELVEGTVQKVQKGEFSFFSIKRGEQIKYQIVEDKDAKKGDKVYVFTSDGNKVKISEKECESRSGCNFNLDGVEDFDGSIYIGESKSEDSQEVVKFAIDKSYTKRVREDTVVYLKKEVGEKKNYQVVVNTHNVLLYAASEEKCVVPSEKCHQKVGNSHNPFIYQSQSKGNLIIAVHSLDESQFTVNIIEQNGQYPELKDGVPFTYLMDDGEEDVIFKFNFDQKEDLTFSLIAPLNQLALYVIQSSTLPKNYAQDPQLYSLDGYININKSKIKSKDFIIVVKKIDPKNAKFVHFTIIVSTKNANIKLQSGVTHHQKLTKDQHQDFVIQFDPSRNYLVSFYIHDSIGQTINLSLDLSKNDTYKNSNDHMFYIDRQVDQIDITQEGKKVCQMKGTTSCQVFLRIANKMSRDANIQLTLLSENSIIELQDGLWQYFPQQLTFTTSHFYFFPKHTNNPISIFYQSNNPDLRILYSLTKMDTTMIDPELWQFPNLNLQMNKKEALNLGVKQVKHISIGKDSLKTCQPNCLLLITLVKSEKVQGDFTQVERDKQFGILVSNNIIDIPQKTRMDVTIQKGESKYMKMNMKNVFEHDTLTAYIYTSLGDVSVYANACSNRNLRMPSSQEFDFSFGILQTQLRTQTIKRKFEQNDIDEDESSYLCLVAVSEENSKFSIQYTSQEEIVSLLRLDEFKTVELDKGEIKYFQIEGSVQNTIKVVRNKGFPYIEYKKCTGKDLSYEECLQIFQDGQKNAKSQIVQKVKRYQYEPCRKCIVYLKLYSDEPAEVDLHLESKYTEITLQQNKITTDYVQKEEQNRYEITSLVNQPTFITVNVIEGDIQCQVTDLNSIDITKQSDSKQRVLHFSISPSQFQQSKSSISNKKLDNPLDSLFSGFGLQKIFTTLHILIQPKDLEKGASYTIQYSSGQRESYLQDGLVNSYKLEGNSPRSVAKFYYKNFDQKSNVFVFLGAKKSSELSKLDIKIFEMQSEEDESEKKEIDIRIPQIRKKTQKPTILYPLPVAKFYSIEIRNPTGIEIELSIGVNHEEVLFLPYETEYPFALGSNGNSNFIVDVKNKGYVLLTLKKCDQSRGEISYTFDYEGFLNNEFQFTSSLNTDPKFEYLIKVKKPGPLYINVKRNKLQEDTFNYFNTQTQMRNSLFSINARFSDQRMNTTDFMKPGNNGLITYEILSNNKIKLQFDQITCPAKNQFCTDKFEYFLIASEKMIDVYSQTVCPSTYFVEIDNKQKRQILPLKKILQKPVNHKITSEYQFQKDTPISYLAVKAIYKNLEGETIEIYYRPIEVTTFWGQVQKASSRFGLKVAVVISFAFCVFLICLRRQKRKGYKSLQSYE